MAKEFKYDTYYFNTQNGLYYIVHSDTPNIVMVCSPEKISKGKGSAFTKELMIKAIERGIFEEEIFLMPTETTFMISGRMSVDEDWHLVRVLVFKEGTTPEYIRDNLNKAGALYSQTWRYVKLEEVTSVAL